MTWILDSEFGEGGRDKGARTTGSRRSGNGSESVVVVSPAGSGDGVGLDVGGDRIRLGAIGGPGPGCSPTLGAWRWNCCCSAKMARN
jgi:hypothetical protein